MVSASVGQRRPSLSMLGWALNEESNLAEYVSLAEAFLREATDDFELVLIDDGSTDRTWALMQELRETRPWMVLVKNERNRGSGYCYRKAIATASKDYFFVQTVDWAYDISELGRSFHLLSDYDILQGVREDTLSFTGALRRSDNAWKALVSFVNYGLIRALFRVPVRDYQNVTVCPTKRVQACVLNADSSFANPEVLIKMWWSGAHFLEVPVRFRKRQRGTATGTRWRSVFRSIREILSYWTRWVVLNGYPKRGRGRVSRRPGPPE
jgi:glycosyltransferase involved in cell wall biosynthesis